MQTVGGNTPVIGAPQDPQQDPADLRSIFSTLWRRKWLILACALILPAAAYALSSQIEKTYEATAELQIQAQSIDTTLFTVESVPAGRSLAATAKLVQTTGVAEAAAEELSPPPSEPRSLLELIEVTADDQSGFLTITASAGSAQRAADIANAFAAAIVEERAENARSQLDEAIARLEANLAELPRRDRVSRRQLSQQVQRLRALRAAQGSNAQIVEPALPPQNAVSPQPVRNAILAGILGILVGVGLAFLLERINRKIRDDHEVEAITGRPLLATVPVSAFETNGRARDAVEAFQTLRAGLTYFNIDRTVRRVLVTSPVKGDGKTTVSVNLALAYARAGKDVILVDADMRNPQIVTRLGLTNDYGLASVLVGERTLEEALVEVSDVGSGRLRVLRAGPPPPNPSELMASERMESLLTELDEQAELVIVDTPPLLVVADAMPIVEGASGVVAVARLGQTSRDALARLATVISAAGGEVLGVVVTGATRRGAYGYGYGYGYGGGRENGSAPAKPADTVATSARQ